MRRRLSTGSNEGGVVLLLTAVALLLLLSGMQALLQEQFRVLQVREQHQNSLSAAGYALAQEGAILERRSSALFVFESARSPLPLAESLLEVSLLRASERSPGLVNWGELAAAARARGCYFSRPVSEETLRRCLRQKQPQIFSEHSLQLSSLESSVGARQLISARHLRVDSLKLRPSDTLIAVGDIAIESISCPAATDAPALLYSALGRISIPEDAAECLRSCRLLHYAPQEQSNCPRPGVLPQFVPARLLGKRLRPR